MPICFRVARLAMAMPWFSFKVPYCIQWLRDDELADFVDSSAEQWVVVGLPVRTGYQCIEA